MADVVINAQFNTANIVSGAQKATRSMKVLDNAIGGALGRLASNIISSAANSFAGLAGSLVTSAIAVENMTTQFTTLTGSVQSAEKHVRDLQQFAAKTPFQLEGIASASAKLQGFGFQASLIPDLLQKIGDVASASGTPLGEIALIYGQVGAAGKLTGERLLQLQERAIPILPALAKQLGVAESAIKDLVSAGKVDLDTFTKAFESLSAQGGVAFEGMIRASKTTSGLISTLKDNFNLTAAEFGKKLLPALKQGALVLTDFAQWLGRNKAALIATAKQLTYLTTVTVAAYGAVKLATFFMNTFTASMLANPIFLAATAISLLAGSILAYNLATKNAIPTQSKSNSQIRETIRLRQKQIDKGKARIKIIKQDIALQKSKGALADRPILEAREYELQQLERSLNLKGLIIRSDKDHLKVREQAKLSRAQEVAFQKALTVQTLKLSQIRGTSARRAFVDQINNLRIRQQLQSKISQEELQIEKDTGEQLKQLAIERLAALKIVKIDAKVEELRLKDELTALERQKILDFELEKIQITKQAEIDQANVLKDEAKKKVEIQKARNKAELDQEKAKNKAKIEGVKNTVKAEKSWLKSLVHFDKEKNSDRAANFKSTLGTIATLQSSGNSTLFAIGKAAAVSQATIDGILAVQKALASAPPPYNYALAALVGTATAVNVHKILAEPPPKFAGGGVFNSSGRGSIVGGSSFYG